MSAAEVHLASVHLPVVLFPVAVTLLVVARLAGSELVFRAACGFVLVAAAFSLVAYFSGPYAFDQLSLPEGPDVELAEQHAVAGRLALIAAVLTAAMALVAVANVLQGEQPHPILRWALLAAALLASGVFAWVAHAGGMIRHIEIRPSLATSSRAPTGAGDLR